MYEDGPGTLSPKPKEELMAFSSPPQPGDSRPASAEVPAKGARLSLPTFTVNDVKIGRCLGTQEGSVIRWFVEIRML